MKITDALKRYRVKKADLEATQARILVYQEALKSNNLHLLGYYTKKPTELGMPKSRYNISQVEREIFCKDEETTLTKELVIEWINIDYDKLWSLRLELSQIEAALSALTREERSIIEWKYMDNMNWYHIELSYMEQYKQALTSETIRKKCSQAVYKIIIILDPFYKKFRNI